MVADLAPAGAQSQSFARAVGALRRSLVAQLGAADLRHLWRMQRWGRLCSLLGYALAPWCLNPLAALLMSQGNVTRWLLMHHIGHRGYDKVPGVPARYTSRAFARGWRRYVDWFDWILPQAWCHEHNLLHHSHTGEQRDPDLVERNLAESWVSAQPRWVRYATVVFFAATWKLSYYAPNTFMTLDNIERGKRGAAPQTNWWVYFNPFWRQGQKFWRQCLLPYGLARFVLLPGAFLLIGPTAAKWVLLNSLLAELITNVHTFFLIAPNHAGDDLYRFDDPEKDRAEFFVRQVLGSTNYHYGSDGLDFSQMWLNYQIEHHVFPDLPMRQYQRVAPQLKALCAEHGLPYVQQSVFARSKKLIDVMVGKTRMRRVGNFADVHLAAHL